MHMEFLSLEGTKEAVTVVICSVFQFTEPVPRKTKEHLRR